MAVIEFARNVLHMEDADSTEMAAKTQYPVIDLMDSQLNVTEKGGTMRLGAYKCELTEGSKAYEAYGQKEIQERHRHRYEFNSKYREDFEKAGMITTGINPESGLTEIVEIPTHKWFVGVQFHPEYKSTVIKPHPLFVSFIKACLSYRHKKRRTIRLPPIPWLPKVILFSYKTIRKTKSSPWKMIK